MNNSPWVKMQSGGMPSDIGQRLHVEKGGYIYTQEESADYLHFLTSGHIKICLINSDGREKTLAIHETGHFFGETAFFNQSLYFANAIALSDCTIMRYRREEVRRLITQDPDISLLLLQNLGQKVLLLTFQVEYLSFMNIEKRVTALLMSLVSVRGTPCEDGMRLDIRITDQELGNMLGIRREAVTKSLSKLKSLGLLFKREHLFYFPSMQALEEFQQSE